jgi:hypothetical protein
MNLTRARSLTLPSAGVVAVNSTVRYTAGECGSSKGESVCLEEAFALTTRLELTTPRWKMVSGKLCTTTFIGLSGRYTVPMKNVFAEAVLLLFE